MAKERMFKIDKFLGINESADSARELKMGEASKMENFAITDAGNLTTRPGIAQIPVPFPVSRLIPLALRSEYIGDTEYLIYVGWYFLDQLLIFTRDSDGNHVLKVQKQGAMLIGEDSEFETVKIFPFAGKVYIMSPYACVTFDGETVSTAELYTPTVITGADPAGGGTALESVNLLSPFRKAVYSAKEGVTAYVLPSEAQEVTAVTVDNAAITAGSYNADTHTYTFATAPAEGVNNVEFTYKADSKFTQVGLMPYWELYNGATDTRIFFYGDGTNKVLYSGVPMSGDLSKLYMPAMNEIAVDMTDSPVTGMIRHYGKLFAFKPDGAYTITYQPVTLTGGDTVAGFYLRPVHKTVGNDMPGQVQLVSNYPRTMSHGNIYEWRTPTSYLVDERYAKNISQRVRNTIAEADPKKVITCDDNGTSTYYMFLNDEQGTILVNRSELDVWTVWRSQTAKNVKFATMFGGTMYFAVPGRDLYYFSPDSKYDVNPSTGGDPVPVTAVWESGYMDFGADYLRKYSSQIWVAMLPQTSSKMTVTAATDRRDEYVEKAVGANILGYNAIDYKHWTYNRSKAPKNKRLKLKVKKFVYYKLILRVEDPGARATVLSIDQLIRYAGYVK